MFIRLISMAVLLALVANAWLLYERNRILENALATAAAPTPAPAAVAVPSPVHPDISRETIHQQMQPDSSGSRINIQDYRLSSQVSQVLGHLAGLRTLISTREVTHGESPRFLSDLDVLYPDVNIPEHIEQVRLLSDGSLAALLSGDDNRWVVMRRKLLDSYPYLRWQCQVNFELRHGPTHCEQADITASPIIAGFDCKRASSEIEGFICRHDRLMQADLELNRTWELLQKKSPDAITEFEQRIWLLSLDDRCPRYAKERVNCLDEMIRARKSQLERLL